MPDNPGEYGRRRRRRRGPGRRRGRGALVGLRHPNLVAAGLGRVAVVVGQGGGGGGGGERRGQRQRGAAVRWDLEMESVKKVLFQAIATMIAFFSVFKSNPSPPSSAAAV